MPGRYPSLSKNLSKSRMVQRKPVEHPSQFQKIISNVLIDFRVQSGHIRLSRGVGTSWLQLWLWNQDYRRKHSSKVGDDCARSRCIKPICRRKIGWVIYKLFSLSVPWKDPRSMLLAISYQGAGSLHGVLGESRQAWRASLSMSWRWKKRKEDSVPGWIP